MLCLRYHRSQDLAANGLAVDFPKRLAEQLERRFGKFSDRAAELAIQILGPSITDPDPTAVEAALVEIEQLLDDEFPDRQFEEDSRAAGASVDRRHGIAFFGTLAAVAGVVILGSDKSATMPAAIPGPNSRIRGGNGKPPRRPKLGPFRTPGLPRVPKTVLGVKLSANPAILVDKFASQNVALIKSLRPEIIPALRDEVVRSFSGAFTPEESAARLIAKWESKGVPIANGNLAPRVKQIVHNQVSRLNTQITRERQTSAGITRFRWISQRDSDVRPLHEELDGQEFDWQTGAPGEGLPGEPPNCRCFAEAVVDPGAIANAPGFVQLANAEIGLDF